MLPPRATLLLLAIAGAATAALTASATTGDSYAVVVNPSDQAMARRVLVRNDFKVVGTGFTAMSDASSTCEGLHPRKRDLMVTGAAEASDASSTVTHILVKVFRTAQMAHADWQRTAVAPDARRCRLTQFRSWPPGTLTARKVGIAKVAPYQTAFLGTGRTNGRAGDYPTYAWNVILVKGRTEIDFSAQWGDTKSNERDAVAYIARSLLAHVSR